MSEPNIFFRIAVSVAEAATFNPKGTKTLLTNVLNKFTIKGKLGFSNGPISLPWNPPNYFIVLNWVFEKFILAEKLFAKALRIFEICVLVNIELHGTLV